MCLSPKSKSAEEAIDRAINTLHNVGLIIPEYLKLTPIYIDSDKKYDYSNKESWQFIQYLPDKIKDNVFYIPNNNPYENILKNNYDKLNKKRTNNLSKLKNRNI